jgi:hypothetical protein
MTLLPIFEAEIIFSKMFSFSLFFGVSDLGGIDLHWDNLIFLILVDAIRDMGMPLSLLGAKVVVAPWFKGFLDDGKALNFMLYSLFPFVDCVGPVFLVINSSSEAFTKSISELCYGSNLSI